MRKINYNDDDDNDDDDYNDDYDDYYDAAVYFPCIF